MEADNQKTVQTVVFELFAPSDLDVTLSVLLLDSLPIVWGYVKSDMGPQGPLMSIV